MTMPIPARIRLSKSMGFYLFALVLCTFLFLWAQQIPFKCESEPAHLILDQESEQQSEEQNECPTCPVSPDSPACPVCPDSPAVPVCPDSPACPVCPDSPACPVCPDTPACPVCPDSPDCPVCPDSPACPVCPDSPDCPNARPPSRCPLQQTKPAEKCGDGLDFEGLMEGRRRAVREQCTRNNYTKARPLEVFYFDRVGRNGIAWCPIYKAASSTTSAHFCPLYYEDCSELGAQIWRNDYFSSELVQPDSPSLLIVRNPFERLLSAYRDKIQSPNPDDPFLKPIIMEILRTQRLIPPSLLAQKNQLLKAALHESAKFLRSQPDFNRGRQSSIGGSENPYLTPISATFEEFVRGALSGFKWSSEHWTPVCERCAPCSETFDFVIKSERYHCEFPEFLKAINFTEDRSKSATHINFNPVRAGRDNSEFFQFYGSLPDNLLDSLHDWYRPDCEMFGYDCEGMVCQVREWKRLHLYD